QASRVTLLGNKALREWLADISTQTRNTIDAGALSRETLDRPLELAIRERNFWPTLDELASRGEFTLEPDHDRHGLALKPGAAKTEKPLTIGYAGPFRLIASPAEIVPIGGRRDVPDLRLRRNLARIALAAQPEPRLRALFLQF